jgi:hypothetical protein
MWTRTGLGRWHGGWLGWVSWLADPGDGLIDLSPRVMNSMYVYIYIKIERELTILILIN